MINNLYITHINIAAQWHPTKNGNLKPTDFVAGSHKKVWWKCDVSPDHEWEAQIRSRLVLSNCPCCSGRKVVLSNCLATTHPEIAAQWHPSKNGQLTPYNTSYGSERKIWWKCNIASDHEWQATISNRIKGRGCSCCVSRTIVNSNCLATIHPDISKEWHPIKNGELTPYNVSKRTSKKIWWSCSEGHEWQANISDRTKLNGSNCPICFDSHGEKKIKIFLEKNKITYEFQKKFKYCKLQRPLPFDFYLPKHNLLIEYDGEQHFRPIKYFGGENKFNLLKKKDEIKNKFAKENNILILRIPYINFNEIESILTDYIQLIQIQI